MAEITIPPELAGKLVVSVPVAGRCLGIGRDSAYRAVSAGDIPSLRIGRRVVVPVAKLLEMLGVSTGE
ncbi:helix-turn-helix domain-containing protein [Microbacterium sp. che218]|uniref:helix-turn-helix domain-containing protein n=1 Tax=Microbacterium sp. che218 TaxID=3140649 RepID=UPI003367DCBE